MNLPDIRALVAVVETGSLAHAAVKLGLTQPAVTRRIQRLEDSLGVQLLDRDVKPARVTAEGRTAYSECLRVITAADGLRSAFGAAPEVARPLRVGVSTGAADLVLSALLSVPEASERIAFEIHSSPTIERGIDEQRFDVGLVLRHTDREPAHGERLATLPAAIVVARDTPLPAHTKLTALRGLRWVLCPDGCGFRRALEHHLYGAAQPLDIVAALWGFDRQAALVAAGVGVGLLPLRIIELSPHRDRLKIVKVSDFSAALDIWLLRSAAAGTKESRFEPFRRAIEKVLGQPVAAAS